MLPLDDKSTEDSSEYVSESEGKPTFSKQKHSLYLRFGQKLDQNRDKASADIKKLRSKIIKVRFPRQKSARFCLVDFANEKDCNDAIEPIRTQKFHGNPILVRRAACTKQKKVDKKSASIQENRDARSAIRRLVNNIIKVHTTDRRRSVTNMVCIKGLPRATQEADLQSQFIEPLVVRLVVPKLVEKQAMAFVTLPSPRDALTATTKRVTIRGQTYKVHFAKDEVNDSTKAKRKSKTDDRYFKQIKTEIKQEDIGAEDDGIQVYN